MNIRDFLCKFKNAKRSGSGWTARSPAHDDQHNSLSIGEGEGGRVLLYCRARCSTTQVCDALGIELKDLMSAPTMRAMKRGAEARIVKSYEYTDETGCFIRTPPGA